MKKIWILFITILLLISCSKADNLNNNDTKKQNLIDSENAKIPVIDKQPNF